MASITITVPDAVAYRVFDAFAEMYGYNADSGITKPVFTKRCIVDMVKNVVIAHESNQASRTAAETAANTARTDIAIT